MCLLAKLLQRNRTDIDTVGAGYLAVVDKRKDNPGQQQRLTAQLIEIRIEQTYPGAIAGAEVLRVIRCPDTGCGVGE